jgi:hypothetical protein
VTVRGVINDELSTLDVIMRHMRTRCNDFSPISWLPPKLLAIVFTLHAINHPPLGQDHTYRSDDNDHCVRRRCCHHHHYRDFDDNHDDNHNGNRDRPHPSNLTPVQLTLGWITVTHLSRHWRQVALSNPKLWVNIVFDLGTEWAKEMLEIFLPLEKHILCYFVQYTLPIQVMPMPVLPKGVALGLLM